MQGLENTRRMLGWEIHTKLHWAESASLCACDKTPRKGKSEQAKDFQSYSTALIEKYQGRTLGKSFGGRN